MPQPIPDLAHADVTQRIIEAAWIVFREMGHGFAEAVYRRSLAIVLSQGGIHVLQLPPRPVFFRGHQVGKFYPDLIVAGVVLVELKATARVEPYAEAQLLNYLKAAGGGVGLLLNFGRTVEVKRRVMGDPQANLPNLRLTEHATKHGDAT